LSELERVQDEVAALLGAGAPRRNDEARMTNGERSTYV